MAEWIFILDRLRWDEYGWLGVEIHLWIDGGYEWWME